jgi:Autotransporter beta-domain
MDLRVRPHATLGATHYFGDSPTAEVMFAGQPGGATRFETRTPLGDTLYTLAAGLEVLSNVGMSIQLEAFVDSSASSGGYGASLDIRVPF